MSKVNYHDYVARYLAGATPQELAAEAGVDGSTMYRNLRALGIPMRDISQSRIGRPNGHLGKSNLKRRKFDYQHIADLYLAGQSLKQIAVTIGAGDENVRYALQRLGIPRRPRGGGKGDANHQYKGGVYQRKNGYQVARGSRSKPLEHRRVAALALGRPLEPGMVVHHIDCNPANNAPDNLLVCSHAYHMELHARMRAHPYWSQFCNPLKSHE